MDNSGPLILYAEDEEILAELAVTALEDAGFRVARFRSSAQAMAALDERGGEFGAMVTDIDLGPKPDGWGVAQHARELHPDMPVVYVSGGHSADWASRGVPGSIMIAKPYAAGQLVVAVSTAMLGAEPHGDKGD